MRNPSIRSLAFLCLACAGSTSLFSAVAVIQARHVPPENIEAFVHRETTYWSEVARKAINEGKLQRWELWRRVGGFDLPGKPNFVFRNVLASWEGMDHISEIWDASKVFPNVKMADMDTFGLGTVTDTVFIEIVDAVIKSPAQFIRVNLAKAPSVRKYIELEQTVWKPYIEQQIKAGTTNVVSWGISRVVIPAGTSKPYDAFTVDGFASLSDALNPDLGDYSMVPDIDTVFDAHEKVAVDVYALVKAVSPEK